MPPTQQSLQAEAANSQDIVRDFGECSRPAVNRFFAGLRHCHSKTYQVGGQNASAIPANQHGVYGVFTGPAYQVWSASKRRGENINRVAANLCRAIEEKFNVRSFFPCLIFSANNSKWLDDKDGIAKHQRILLHFEWQTYGDLSQAQRDDLEEVLGEFYDDE